jgi:hypothetical protein
MTRIIFFIALTVCVMQPHIFAASNSEASFQKLCCQNEIHWKYTKGSGCTSCHTRYFDEVYGEYSGELPRRLQPLYIKDYLSVAIQTLDFKNDPDALPLLKRMLDKIPAKYAAESSRFFFDAAENMNISLACLDLLKAHGADLYAQNADGETPGVVAEHKDNVLVQNYLLRLIWGYTPSTESAQEETLEMFPLLWPKGSAYLELETRQYTRMASFWNSNNEVISRTTFPSSTHFLIPRSNLSDEDSSDDSESKTSESDFTTEGDEEQNDSSFSGELQETSHTSPDTFTGFSLSEIGGAGGVSGLWPEPGSDVESFFGSYQPPQEILAKREKRPENNTLDKIKERNSKRRRHQQELLRSAQNSLE